MKKILAIILMLLPLLTYSQGSIDYDNWIYKGDKSITEYTIPDGVKVIGDEAFMNCENLMTITIPKVLHRLASRHLSIVKVSNPFSYLRM